VTDYTQRFPLTSIHPDARIGEGVIIEPFTVIHADVEIGANTWIGSNVAIHDGARIGTDCKIFPGAVISSIPQDLKFKGEKTYTYIGNHTTLREYVTVNRGTAYLNYTQVGNHCTLLAYSHVAHDCVVGDHVIMSNAVNMAGHVVVEDYAIIGGLSGIHQFVRIGRHTMIAAGTVIRKDVPPFTKAGRMPLSYEGVNSIGMRRRGFTPEMIQQVQEIYRIIFLSGNNNTQALDVLEARIGATPERDEIIQFIRNSSRGIMKGYIG
jgi:UDP-N-acetylglucosamine acyltransferase